MQIWAEPANPLQESPLTEGIEPWTFILTPAPRYFFLPPSQECVQCIRDQGVSFIRHLGNIPSGRLTSPLRGARFSFTTSSVAPADQRFARAVVTTLLALGACSVFFFFFFNFADSWERCGNTEQMARGRSGALTNDRRVPRCCLSVCRDRKSVV